MIRRKKYRLESFDGRKSIELNNGVYIAKEVDLGSAAVSLTTYQGTNKYGMLLIDRSVNIRDISIIGYILAGDVSQEEMRKLKRDLQQIINPMQDFKIIVDDKYYISVSADASVKYGVNWYENNNMMCMFSITGIATDPYFYDYEESNASTYYTEPLFHFPLLTRSGGN